MRAAVVYFKRNDEDKELEQLAKALQRGLQSKNGLNVDVISLRKNEEARLSGYAYIAMGVPVTSWFKGRLPEGFKEVLGRCGVLGGKKSFAFVPKKFLGSDKTLAKLMAAMESEGMFLRYSEVLLDEEHAQETAAALTVE